MYYPNYISMCHGQKLDSLWAQASTQRGGEVAPLPMSFPTILCSTDHLPMSLQYFLCPFGLVVNFEGIFGGCVGCVGGSNLNDRFRSLCLATCRCPHDITDRHRLSCIAVALLSLVGGMAFALNNNSGSCSMTMGMLSEDWIASWNLDIPWSKVLGLADVVPRMRVRLWLLARRSMIPWSSLEEALTTYSVCHSHIVFSLGKGQSRDVVCQLLPLVWHFPGIRPVHCS